MGSARLLLPVALAGALACSTTAQSPQDTESLKKEIETLKARQRALEQEMLQIKQILQGQGRQQGPEEVDISIAGAPFKGSPTAKLTLVEFSDFHCPFCARHFKETMPQIEKEYVQTGKLKYVFRDFPIESLHPRAFKAHEAAGCAADQSRYWEMHDRLFNNPRNAAPADFVEHARVLGLNVSAFQQCLESEKHAANIRQDISDAVQAGANGTPTLFLGITDPKGSTVKVKAPFVIRGALPYDRFKQVIEALLKQAD